MSTGLEHGLAVPHGAVDCVGTIVAALVCPGPGVPFESVDNLPATVIALLVIPKAASSATCGRSQRLPAWLEARTSGTASPGPPRPPKSSR